MDGYYEVWRLPTFCEILKCHIVIYTTSRNVDQMRLNALRKHDLCSQIILYFISEWIAERALANSAQMLWLRPSPALTD
jgi:hypothetical protein